MYPTKGKVVLIGAGPGDPELLTLKAVRWLREADVVLADRLVSPEIISSFTAPGAEIIHVGKQCRKGASTPQPAINDLMVQKARLGKLVVRLKGGDVSVFSNVLDELETLVRNQIMYEIVPGITAASGAAAYSGIPLTARGHATAVRYLTCYQANLIPDDQWKELAKTGDTLVFYMSAETLPQIIRKLTGNGISDRKELAVIEQATTPFQKITTGSLYEFESIMAGRKPVSPSLLIIGTVVDLHHQFKWMPDNISGQTYFEPVAAKLFGYGEEAEEINLLTA